MGIPGGLDGQESTCNMGDPSSIPGLERSPGEVNGNPLQYSCLENSTDWEAPQSLVGYSPWDRKESDTTEQLHFTLLIIFIMYLASILFWLNIFTGVSNCKYAHINNTESKNINKNEQNFKLCNF